MKKQKNKHIYDSATHIVYDIPTYNKWKGEKNMKIIVFKFLYTR